MAYPLMQIKDVLLALSTYLKIKTKGINNMKLFICYILFVANTTNSTLFCISLLFIEARTCSFSFRIKYEYNVLMQRETN